MSSQPVVDDVMQWLQTKHTTMWGGEGWTITKDDTCRRAAEWFVSQINEFQQWRECEGCADVELVDALAVALVNVIGTYVPVEDQQQWNDLLVQYVQYRGTENV